MARIAQTGSLRHLVRLFCVCTLHHSGGVAHIKGVAGTRALGLLVMVRQLPRFKCLYCDHCCYFEKEYEMPTVFPWEKRLLEELAENLGVSLEFKPLQVYMDDKRSCIVTLYRWIIQGYCPFYDREKHRCRIHRDKPYACKMYPLLLEMPSGKLMLSGKCDWVANNKRVAEQLSRNVNLIPRVFPNEFEAAKNAFIEFSSIAEYVEKKGLKPVTDLKTCATIMDIDEYIARYG